MKKLHLSYYTVILFVTAWFFGCFNEYFSVFVIALIHELFHMFAALILGHKVIGLRILPFGACLQIEKDRLSLKHEFIIAVSGPFSNLLMLTVCILLKYYLNYNLVFFAYANIYMMLLNLVPAFPLDGGRIFRTYLKDFFSEYEYAEKILSTFVSLFIITLGTYLLIKTGGNFSLLMAGFFMANCINFTETKTLKLYDTMYKNNEYYRSSVVALNENIFLDKCIKYIAKDKFLIICILNDNKEITGITTNAQLMHQIASGCDKMRLKDLHETEKNNG